MQYVRTVCALIDRFHFFFVGEYFDVNHVPVVSNDTETVTQNHEYTFTLDDFALTDSDGTSEEKIRLTNITHGKVKLSGTEVTLNQEITMSDITNSNLKFISDLNFAGEADVNWQGYSGDLWSNVAVKQITVNADVIAPTMAVTNKQVVSKTTVGLLVIFNSMRLLHKHRR